MQKIKIECYSKKSNAQRKLFVLNKGVRWCLNKGDIVGATSEQFLASLNREKTKLTNVIIPNLMMRKLEMGQQTFLLDPPAKTWKQLCEICRDMPQVVQILQLSTTRGEQVVCHLTNIYKTSYPGQPIRITLDVVLWIK